MEEIPETIPTEPRPVHRARLERPPREVSIHARREFAVAGEIIEAPAARVTLLENGLTRVEWNPVYDASAREVRYMRRREVPRKLIERQAERAAKFPKPAGRRGVEHDTRTLLMDLIREQEVEEAENG